MGCCSLTVYTSANVEEGVGAGERLVVRFGGERQFGDVAEFTHAFSFV